MPYGVRIGANPYPIETGPTTDAQAFAIENPLGTVVAGISPSGQDNGSLAASIVLATGNTVTPSSGGGVFAPAGAITGVIMAAGTYDGQEYWLINNSANSITFAAVGTSNVADGVSAVVGANTRMLLVWSAAAAKWFHGN